MSFDNLSVEQLEGWLRERNPGKLDQLWQAADETRRRNVGDEVHLRGLIEVSNHCSRHCGYCGIRVANPALTRYRMTQDEVLACAHEAADYGYGTVVLQAGEDPMLTTEWVEGLIRRIKSETSLAVTLSLGERGTDELRAWRAAGADRYLLRFETSDPELYAAIHPGKQGAPSHPNDRISLLKELQQLGFEAGSGIMLGLPGQTYASVAHDLALFRELDLDMVGIGPFIAHPNTPLGRGAHPLAAPDEQIDGDELSTLVTMALTRLMCPEANIPSTTALAALNPESGREAGLKCGANVLMPNLTPAAYREHYEIYPAKARSHEDTRVFHHSMQQRIMAIGRKPGHGAGARKARSVSP